MNSIKILTRLTVGLLLLAGILYIVLPERGKFELFPMFAAGAGAWSFIALLAALVIKSIKASDNK
ncbi:MAG: hypothetical protein IPH12_16855 [Saprospirales bacterium]|nr:hypothetical protein [Saprospirales bacterium]MBK8920242.1 hypothetical protein [Saprospirales bacterium]MBK8920303.1 hypothetical protein [Saprospirales bacterium]